MDLQAKQQFLVDQIIEQGYKPEEFQAFLEKVKPGKSDNIEEWSMPELRDAVSRFKQSGQKEYFKTIEGVRITKSIIGTTDALNVKITHFEKIPGGFFSNPSTVFHIETQPQSWKVQRKFSDFVQLRDILSRQNPGLSIPKIHEPKSADPFGQIDLLQRFIKQVLDTPEYLNSPQLELFLSLNTNLDWNNAAKAALKQEKARRIDQIQSMSGEIPVRINQELNVFYDNAEQVISSCGSVLRKVRKLSKQLYNEMGQVQSTLNELGTAFSMIQGAIFPFHEATHIPDFAKSLKSMVEGWALCFNQERELIRRTFIQSLKFTSCQLNDLLDLIQIRDQAQQEFCDFQTKLMQRKAKLFAQDSSKWELDPASLTHVTVLDLHNNRQLAYHHMLPKDTFHCRELKNIFGFYNQRVYEAIKQTMGKAFNIKDFLSFSKDQAQSVMMLHQLWADSITNFHLLYESYV